MGLRYSFLVHLGSNTCLHMVHCVFGGLPRVIKQHDACCVQPIRAFLYIVHDSQNYRSDRIIARVWQQTTPATKQVKVFAPIQCSKSDSSIIATGTCNQSSNCSSYMLCDHSACATNHPLVSVLSTSLCNSLMQLRVVRASCALHQVNASGCVSRKS